MVSIKIGRTEHEVKPGDYIVFNGSVYNFVAADGRALKRDRMSKYTTLRLSKDALDKVPFAEMVKSDYVSCGSTIEKWVFILPNQKG